LRFNSSHTAEDVRSDRTTLREAMTVIWVALTIQFKIAAPIRA
jgi:hypothetical protein